MPTTDTSKTEIRPTNKPPKTNFFGICWEIWRWNLWTVIAFARSVYFIARQQKHKYIRCKSINCLVNHFQSNEHTGLCSIWGSHSGGYEEFYLLGDNAMQSVESQTTFRSSRKPSFPTAFRPITCLANPEDGGNVLLRNVGWLSSDYMALYLEDRWTLHTSLHTSIRNYRSYIEQRNLTL
jgi:hypothetical protein